MNKLLIILFTISLAFTSCSSDDNTNIPTKTKGKLVIETTSLTTYVNKPVYLTIKDERGEVLTDRSKIINVNNSEEVTSYGRFKPTHIGQYQLIAKATINGFAYKDSDPIFIKVLEPTEKVFRIDGKYYPVSKATLSIKRVKVKDNNGNDITRDKIIVLGQDYNCNEYVLDIVGGTPYLSSVTITFLVYNESVKATNGQITDYGKRALPNNVEATILKQLIIKPAGGTTTIQEVISSPTRELEFYSLTTPKEGLENQVLSKSYFGLETKRASIDYIGDLTFSEIIE